jgi:hypothetical protein
LEFGELVDDELFGLMSTVDVAIIPKWSQPFIVIRVKVCKEVLKCPSRKRFAKVEIVHKNVGICDDPRHIIRQMFEKLYLKSI